MIPLTLIAIALIAVAATSYRMGRADERRRQSEQDALLARVVGRAR